MSNSSPGHASAFLLRATIASNFKALGDEMQLPDSEIVDILARNQKETAFIRPWSRARAGSL